MEEFKKPSRKGIPNIVNNSIGVYDIYKFMRKKKWYNIGRPLKEKEYYAIIRGVNLYLADELAKGNMINLPHRMGKFDLRRFKRGASIVNGKLKVTYPVNWGDTLMLWEKDEDARREKILMRYENRWIYYIKYLKRHAVYNNKEFYQFDLNTFIKRNLSENIKQGKLDTQW